MLYVRKKQTRFSVSSTSIQSIMILNYWVQPRSDIIFATTSADTVEFPSADFTATQTEDDTDGEVGIGAEEDGIGFVELVETGTLEFVEVTGGVAGTLGGNDGVTFVELVEGCEICAWFRFACS